MRRYLPPLPLLLLPLSLLGACDNPCQDVCKEMATYAEECGFTVSIDDVNDCNEQFTSDTLGDEDKELCRAWSDGDALREWWTCEDVAANFQNGAGGAAAAE